MHIGLTDRSLGLQNGVNAVVNRLDTSDDIRMAGESVAELSADGPAGRDSLVCSQRLQLHEVISRQVLVEGVEHPGASVG